MRALLKTRVSDGESGQKCVRVVQNHDFKPPLSGKSGQKCVRVAQNHTCRNSRQDLPDRPEMVATTAGPNLLPQAAGTRMTVVTQTLTVFNFYLLLYG